VDNKRATVPQTSANVAEAYGMAESCTAAVGDALMTTLLKFMKVAKKIKKCTAPTVAVSDVLLMGFTGGYGRFSYIEAAGDGGLCAPRFVFGVRRWSCATASRRRYADRRHLRKHLRQRNPFERKA
jgi:hypothetical protein